MTTTNPTPENLDDDGAPRTLPPPTGEQLPRGHVLLYEDSAGGLTIWRLNHGYGYSGLETVGGDGRSFIEDAADLARGATDNWTLPRTGTDPRTTAQLVAVYSHGYVTIYTAFLGAAARDYLKADLAWARAAREKRD